MEEETIHKSWIDKREYRFKQLANGLRVLYVSDPQEVKAAFSLSVAAGSMHDPDDHPGLAHFCEHMLFMGTEQHPAENNFDEFMSKNGGSTNAETEEALAHFFFDCKASALGPALSLFVEFFTRPLFTESCATREIKAIDSEFASIKKLDTTRLHWLSIRHLNTSNPFTKEGHGSQKELSVPGTREALKTFFETRYSANIMTAVVIGSQSLDELDKLVRPLLETIPNKHLPTLEVQLNSVPSIYGPEYNGRLFHVLPTKMQRKLAFKWYLKCYTKEFMSKPYSYALELLGHEGPHSLLSYLKRKEWVVSITSEIYNAPPAYTLVGLSIKLTDKGESMWESVAEAVFGYLKMLQTRNPADYRYLFDEVAFMYSLRFGYKGKEKNIDYASKLSDAMQWYPPAHILDYYYQHGAVSVEKTQEFNDSLRPERVDIFLLSKRFKSSTNRIHKPWGTKYAVSKIPESLMLRLNSPKLPEAGECDFPPPNSFIPYSVSRKPETPLETTVPTLLRRSAYGELWYSRDTSFEVPKSVVTIKLMSSDCGFGVSEEGKVFTELYKRVLFDILSETLYMGQLGGSSFALDCADRGAWSDLKIKSYSVGLLPYVKTVFEQISAIVPDDHAAVFSKQQEKYTKELEGFTMQTADAQMFAYFSSIAFSDSYLPPKLIAFVRGLTFLRFVRLWKEWLQHARYVMCVHGTATSADATAIAQAFEESVLRGAQVLLPSEAPQRKLLLVPEKTCCISALLF